MTSETRTPIALVGLSGAGKSVVARRLGERLGAEVIDLDARFEAASGQSIAESFARDGEAAFRRREGELLSAAVRAPHAVLACGGGIVLAASNRTLLRERCHTVWLEASPAVAAARVRSQAAVRPLLDEGTAGERLEVLLRERKAFYAEVAHARVTTDGRSIDQVAAAVLAAVSTIAPGGGRSA